ncbi:hypothetical protein CHS0354_039889, partial [Potamilus streckersoni]
MLSGSGKAVRVKTEYLKIEAKHVHSNATQIQGTHRQNQQQIHLLNYAEQTCTKQNISILYLLS